MFDRATGGPLAGKHLVPNSLSCTAPCSLVILYLIKPKKNANTKLLMTWAPRQAFRNDFVRHGRVGPRSRTAKLEPSQTPTSVLCGLQAPDVSPHVKAIVLMIVW